MSAAVPAYVVSSSGAWIDAVSSILDETAGVYGSVDELLAAGAGSGGGMLLLGPDVADREVSSLGGALGGGDSAWSVFRGAEPDEEGGVELEPVPLPGSCTVALADVASRLGPTEGDAPPLELCRVLSFVARARHDINNPLTSALAETQLLLMDVQDGEIRAGLETIEEQLRRIRDLVARLQALPRPRSRE